MNDTENIITLALEDIPVPDCYLYYKLIRLYVLCDRFMIYVYVL